jgi:anaphase-promoting complex subunit 3
MLYYYVIQAERMFSEVRQLEPHHLRGMEIYSTALWHLQREVQLSALAQELTELDRDSPEVGTLQILEEKHY